MSTIFRRYLIILSSLQILSYSNSIADFNHLGFGFDNDTETVNIPFKRINNLIILESVVDDDFKLNLILDTGIRSLVLFDKSYIPKVSENTFDITFNSAGIGKPMNAFVSVNHTLRLSKHVVANQINVVIINKSNKYLHKIKDTKIHGAFGYQLFTRFQVKIDYKNQIITLTEPNKINKLIGFESIPLYIHDTKPFVKTDFLTRKNYWHQLNLFLDLGANHRLLLFNIDHIKSTIDQKKSEYRIAEGLSGSIYGLDGFVRLLKLGSILHKNVAMIVPSKSTYHRESIPEIEKHGAIGGKFFDNSVIVIDYINGYLFVEYKNSSVPSENYLTENIAD